MNDTTLRISKKELFLLKQKDDLLFKLLMLMELDAEESYIIPKEHTIIIEKAMHLYLPERLPTINEHGRRPKKRI